ncbi:ABC transporter permease [Listeria monocytogenes]|nr:ABC transporter permease [Listeria monocytogenes]
MKLIKKNKFLIFVLILIYIFSVQFISLNDRMYFVSKQRDALHKQEAISVDYLTNRQLELKENIQLKQEMFQKIRGIYKTVMLTEEVDVENIQREIIFVPKQDLKELQFPVFNKRPGKGAWVGKNVIKELADKNSIEVNGEKIKIIGILGEKGVTNGTFDASIVLPYEDYAYLGDNALSGTISVFDSLATIPDLQEEITSFFSENIESTDINDILRMKTSDIEKIEAEMLSFLGTMFLLLGISLILLTFFWLEEHRYEYAIRKLVGATNMTLLKENMMEMFRLVSLTIGIATILHLISIYMDFPFLNQIRFIFYILIISLFCLFGCLVAITTLYYFRKVAAIDIMKEGG